MTDILNEKETIKRGEPIEKHRLCIDNFRIIIAFHDQ